MIEIIYSTTFIVSATSCLDVFIYHQLVKSFSFIILIRRNFQVEPNKNNPSETERDMTFIIESKEINDP